MKHWCSSAVNGETQRNSQATHRMGKVNESRVIKLLPGKIDDPLLRRRGIGIRLRRVTGWFPGLGLAGVCLQLALAPGSFLLSV